MYKNIPTYSKLLVVSDTGMYQQGNNIYAFEPVVKELDSLLQIFEEITWIGFNSIHQTDNQSYTKVELEKIKVIILDNVGGKSIFDKLKIVLAYPKMWGIIQDEVKNTQYIHSRAPSNPALITMLLSYKYRNKVFWFKYAGNWVGKASKFYRLQRSFLKTLNNNSKITINGNWANNKNNIISFENPCLTEDDRLVGKHLITRKKLTAPYNYCFVGGLNNNKGVALIIDAFSKIKHPNLGTLHIVGDGVLRAELELKAKEVQTPIIFHGYLNKAAIVEIYKACKFMMLPSKSEGFPKVIGEAMNFGCVPIVSDVSCIGQYIINNENGFLLNQITTDALIKSIIQSLNLEPEIFREYLQINYKIAQKFTYSNYLTRVQKEILTDHSITS